MRLLRLFPDDTKIPFMKWRKWSFLFSGLASVICFVVLYTHGMNTGIDFQGGTLMEVQTKSGPADLEGMGDARIAAAARKSTAPASVVTMPNG